MYISWTTADHSPPLLDSYFLPYLPATCLHRNGYEKLCCVRCVQTRDSNFQGSTCICRVPKASLKNGIVVECPNCGEYRSPEVLWSSLELLDDNDHVLMDRMPWMCELRLDVDRVSRFEHVRRAGGQWSRMSWSPLCIM